MVTTVDLLTIVAYALAGVAATLTYVGYSYRDEYGGRGFAVMMAGLCGWLVGYGTALVGVIVPPLSAYNVVILSAGIGSLGWFLLTLEYTRQYFPTGRQLAALAVVPALTQVVVWTNDWHELFWAEGTTVLAGGGVDRVYGPLFVPHALYGYSLIIVGLGLLGVAFIRRHGIYRRHTGMLFVAGIVPITGDVINITTGAFGPRVDLTPITFVLVGIPMTWLLFRNRFFELVPVARQQAVEQMDDGVLTLDDEDRIADANGPARELLGADSDVLGDPVETYLPELPGVLAEDDWTDDPVAVERDGDIRQYDLTVSRLPFGPERAGHVVVMRDVTARERRERELRRQNEQLDQFAAVVSHDLRNPLSIAKTYTDFARETGDDSDFDAVEESLDRMDRMIDDILTFARSGGTIEEMETVSLAETATMAWQSVESGESGLTIECDDATIRADGGRLQHVFENLFRNAIEHNDRPVEIMVSTLEDGFYVADDGAGIPPEDREDVLQQGYTTSEEGVGLGLSIVRTIVEAHNWTVTVTESETGGARFEIRGVSWPR